MVKMFVILVDNCMYSVVLPRNIVLCMLYFLIEVTDQPLLSCVFQILAVETDELGLMLCLKQL